MSEASTPKKRASSVNIFEPDDFLKEAFQIKKPKKSTLGTSESSSKVVKYDRVYKVIKRVRQGPDAYLINALHNDVFTIIVGYLPFFDIINLVRYNDTM